MLTLRGLVTLLIKSTNSLLLAEEGLIDLSTLSLSVLVVALTFLGSLTTSQVDQKKLAALVYSLFLNFDLRNSMTSTRRIVGLRRMCCSHLITLLYQVKDLVVVVDELLLEACNLNRLGLILSKLELVVLIE